MNDKEKLLELVRSAQPGIIMETPDEIGTLDKCYDVAKNLNLSLYFWTLTSGIKKYVENEEDKLIKSSDEAPPTKSLFELGLEISGKKNVNQNAIFCLLDFHPYINQPTIICAAKEALCKAKSMKLTFIFIGCKLELPLDLQDYFASISYTFPTKEELTQMARGIVEDCTSQKYDGEEIIKKTVTDEDIEKAASAALGLTPNAAEKAFAISIIRCGCLEPSVIFDEKINNIRNQGLVEIFNPSELPDKVGGMQELIKYTNLRKKAYSKEAREYGIPFPKGVLLVGIPGCGKSLAAKSIASSWSQPLVKLDIGSLFGKYVGESEKNTRNALSIVEATAPCILWIDEIEKGLSGVNSAGRSDSGVSERMFGELLTWLQENKKAVFVVATANNISNLPPELLRKGRFDEIFFVDLPSFSERKEIWKIQIEKRGKDPADFDLEELSRVSEGYNGAEIEETFVTAMYYSFNEGNGKRKTDTSDVLKAINELKPASKGIMKSTVENLRAWQNENDVKNASSNREEKQGIEKEDGAENKSEDKLSKVSKRGRRSIS